MENPKPMNQNEPLCDPLTVQLSEKEAIPFKIIVKCEKAELSLSSFQRPITIQDSLLFNMINERNHIALKKDIKEYKTLLQQQEERREQQTSEERFGATCKIFLGTQYLGQAKQRVQDVQQQSQAINNGVPQSQSSPITGTNQERDIVNQQSSNSVVKQHKQIIVCGLYKNQTLEELQDFIKPFSNQNVDIVILVNGLKSLEKEVRKELFKSNTKEAKINSEIKQNKYTLSNALVLQYSSFFPNSQLRSQQSSRSGAETPPRVIFVIKYLQSSYFDLQKWIYAGIAKHFDPDYYYVTQCASIPYQDAIQSQLQILNHASLCGVTSNILQTCKSSWSPFNLVNSFLLNQTLFTLENQPVNRLFSVSIDHDPLFCLYNWQETKVLMEQYLFKISKSESDLTQNVIVQGQNCILPVIAAENGLYFAKTDRIVAEKAFPTKLSIMMEEQRKRNNAYYYSSEQFWKTYKYGSSQWKLNTFVRVFQTIILLLRAMLQQLNNYFGISAIVFLISQSSYQFFGTAISFSQDNMVQMILPALFLFALIIFALFSNVFNSASLIATQKHKEQIVVDGKIICYVTQYKTTNTIDLSLDSGSDGECKITQLLTPIKPEDIKLGGSFKNRELILTLQMNNQRYVAHKKQAQQMFDEIYNNIQLKNDRGNGIQNNILQQTQQISRETLKEAFLSIKVNNLTFQYANDVDEAAFTFDRLFCLMAILNVTLLVIFVLNIAMSHFINLKTIYVILICACFLAVIAQKLILILMNPSNFSNFFKGYLSYFFYYLVVTLGMKFYEMANIDRNYENARLDKFYYDKIQAIGIWFTYNIAFLFICFMIEAYYNYCGYVLLAFLIYYGACAILEIFGMILSKFFSTNQKKSKDIGYVPDTSMNSNPQYPEGDFTIEHEQHYKDAFLRIQVEATEDFYEQQQQQTRFIQQEIQNHLEQTKKIFQSMNISKEIKPNHQTQKFQQQTQQMAPIPEEKQNDSSMLDSSNKLTNKQSRDMLESKQQLRLAIPNNIRQDDEVNSMLQSNQLDSVGKPKDYEKQVLYNQKN